MSETKYTYSHVFIDKELYEYAYKEHCVKEEKKLFEKFYKENGDEEVLISKIIYLDSIYPELRDILTFVELYDGLCTYFFMERVNTSSPLIYTIGYKTKEDEYDEEEDENVLTFEEMEELLHPKFKKSFKKVVEEYKDNMKEKPCSE